jgi:hypothetical protein
VYVGMHVDMLARQELMYVLIMYRVKDDRLALQRHIDILSESRARAVFLVANRYVLVL